MSKQDGRAEFKKSEESIIELRYFDHPKAETYFSWKMPVNEANDLVRWWEKEGMQIKKTQLPIVEHKLRNVLISMFTYAGVDVRGFDRYGGLKPLGYSLPRTVVECLSVWLQEEQHTPKLNTRKDPK